MSNVFLNYTVSYQDSAVAGGGKRKSHLVSNEKEKASAKKIGRCTNVMRVGKAASKFAQGVSVNPKTTPKLPLGGGGVITITRQHVTQTLFNTDMSEWAYGKGRTGTGRKVTALASD